MSEFIEYPKMLYRDGEQRIVDDTKAEDAARADGFHDFGATVADDPPAEKPKRGAKAAA